MYLKIWKFGLFVITWSLEGLLAPCLYILVHTSTAVILITIVAALTRVSMHTVAFKVFKKLFQVIIVSLRERKMTRKFKTQKTFHKQTVKISEYIYRTNTFLIGKCYV